MIANYHPQTKMQEGNVFTPACQSFCSHGEGVSVCHFLSDRGPPRQRPPGQRHLLDRDLLGQRPPGLRPPGQRPPWTETPWTETPWTKTLPDRDPLGQRPPWAHPTGLHSCLATKSSTWKRFILLAMIANFSIERTGQWNRFPPGIYFVTRIFR